MHFGQNNTPFTREEFADRWARTRARMDELELDALIVSNPTNLNYLTGYDGWSFYVHQAVVLTLTQAQPIWIGRGQDVNGARLTTVLDADNIVGYPDDYVQTAERHPMQFIAGIIQTRGLGAGTRIGVEADNYYFTGKSLDVLRGELPQADIRDAGILVNWVRCIKSDAEIACIQQAGKISEAIMARALEMIDVGVRQCDLAAEIWRTGLMGVDGYGGDYPAIMPLMPTGAATICPHITWSDRPFEAQTGTTIEISGVRHHYHAPLTRTVYLGQPPDALRRAADIVIEGIDAALAAARPGALARDVHAAWNASIARHGLHKDSRCGYSIGLGYPPDWGEHTVSFRAADHSVLQPNMTIHFMPGIWLDDWGIAISETLRITTTGVETVCAFPRRLFVK